MANKYNPCLAKDDARTYLETYNCEYIKSPKPTRFERAMVSVIISLRAPDGRPRVFCAVHHQPRVVL